MTEKTGDSASAPITRLLAIMERLRDPEGGCPWDVAQTFKTVAPYTIEEAYEVADAISRDAMDELKDELGDLLFQVVFHARMAEEGGHFSFDEVVEAVSDKMERRHPHVFAGATVESAEAQTRAWEEQKAAERAAKAKREGRRPSVLDGVASGLPALMRAVKLQRRAARVGFDWADRRHIFAKVREELVELEEASGEEIAEELGDLLFAVTNLARAYDLDPEESLSAANRKFERRFRRVETLLAKDGKRPEDSDLKEMDAHWDRVKIEERSPSD